MSGAEAVQRKSSGKTRPADETENSNALKPEDKPIHAWYRFVLSYPPHLVRKYLRRFGVSERDVVLDPFCGTGTTLVECMKQGIPCVGVESHPMAYLASSVKTTWDMDPVELRLVRRNICQRAQAAVIAEGLGTLSLTLPMVCDRVSAGGAVSCLSEEEAKLIPKGFLSPKPLRRLVLLRDCLERSTENHSPQVRNFFSLALAHVVVNGAGNFAFGPEIYRTKPKDDYDVEGHFAWQTETMICELEALHASGKSAPAHRVWQGDARELTSVTDDSITAVVTSPPYPNEKDYTRTTRVESVLLRLVTSRQQLREVKESLLRSNTRNVFAADDEEKWVRDIPEIQQVCRAIEARRIELGKTSGFERLYHRVVAHYFGGMARHFDALARKLKAGSLCAYVVGDQLSYLLVPIHTARLLSLVAQRHGFRELGIDLWRSRFATKSKTYVREEVLVLKRP